MEENTAESNALGVDFSGIAEIRLGEIPNEDMLAVYLGRGPERDKGLSDKNVRTLHDISSCRRYNVEQCICSSKIHYEIEGCALCVRDMKPFIYISKMSLLYQPRAKKPKKDRDR